jgi:hypothetical protein
MQREAINPKEAQGAKKVPLSKVPPVALAYQALVHEAGDADYGPRNWRDSRVLMSVYLDAAMRHILSMVDGEDLDPKSGLPHAAHAAACMNIIMDGSYQGTLEDDRPTKGMYGTVFGAGRPVNHAPFCGKEDSRKGYDAWMAHKRNTPEK